MINLTIIFDINYVEPAVVTALDLERFLPPDWVITLIFIESKNIQANAEVHSLLALCLSGKKAQAISLGGDVFDTFEKYHFSNAILYKLMVPQITQCDYQLNIDAGFLSGPNISYLFEYCESLVKSPEFRDVPIAAVCSDAKEDLPLELQGYQHNKAYPAGWLLLFNKAAYEKSGFPKRVQQGYFRFKEQLLWAEQDLLCLISADHEIMPLRLNDQILIEQLTIQDYITGEVSKAWTSPFMLYKITGTLKPWNLWVFDDKKQFYLARRDMLSSAISWSQFPIVQDNRYRITHEPLYRAFLAVHENKQRQLAS